jgi:hypothetical protein
LTQALKLKCKYYLKKIFPTGKNIGLSFLRVKNESILKEILIYSHNCPIVIVVEN